MGLVVKRVENIPNTDPPALRIVSDNPLYRAYERIADEIGAVGRIRWFAREIRPPTGNRQGTRHRNAQQQ